MEQLKVFSPYDGHFIQEVPFHDQGEADAALTLAYKTYLDRDKWLKPYEKIAILEKAAALLEERKDQLAKEAAEEGGKPLIDSLVEANRAVSCVKVAIEQISHLNGKQIPMNISEISAHRIAYTYREPVGVVFAISAFNHPLNLIAHQVTAAVAAGCPVIIKPATSTPISCVNFVNILYEAGLPKEWCQIIVCENSVAEKIVSDSRISYLSFIGSSRVGWYLRTKLPSGARCALEHGGAAPVIVEPDADIQDTLPLLVKGGFYHAGQVCVSVQRVYVQDKICKTLSKQICEMADALIVGDPVDLKTQVGPLITTKEVDRIDSWIKQAINSGAKLLCGGRKISNTCYAPTVLLDPPDDVQVSQQEIFGPVICIYSYKSRQNAIERANQVPYAFQASVFTKNIDVALDTVRRLNAVAVMVNDHTAFRVDWMPFGGRKQSGLGIGGIPYAMEDLTYEKMMVIRSPVL